MARQNDAHNDRYLPLIEASLKESLRVKEALLSLAPQVSRAADLIVSRLRSGGKVVVFGNGGSAADSQHIAAELVGRFEKERPALPAVALTTNTSTLTAVANDYGYDAVFLRQVEALVGPQDAVIAISTSGKSSNVLKAMTRAREKGAAVIAFTGRDGGAMPSLSDVCLIVPSSNTARIQEGHITLGHILCQVVEEALAG